MSDRIRISQLHCRTFIGIEEWEQRERQDVVIDLTLEVDLARAAASDSVEDTVNYRNVAKRIIALVEDERFALVERLAGRIAALVLQEFERVDAITVRAEKPGALRFASSVGVEIRRGR